MLYQQKCGKSAKMSLFSKNMVCQQKLAESAKMPGEDSTKDAVKAKFSVSAKIS